MPIRFATLFALAFSLALSPAQAQTAAKTGGVFGAESFSLANGMQVVVIPNHRAPVVSHMVWYKIGSADEVPGKSGLAHFLEHLLFKGTPRFPAGTITDMVARNGGEQNAFTSYDYTAYYENIAVDRLPLMMDMEADRMHNLILERGSVLSERDVIIEERRMRVDNVPGATMAERLSASLWLNNPYSVPVIGWESEMRELSQEDALAFYKKYYEPHNAILIVAGDITAAQLRPLAEKYYGVIPKTGTPSTRVRPTYLPRKADVRVVMRHERVRQPQWSREYIAPSYNVGDRTDVHGLEVFTELFGGGSTAKLYRSLVVDQQLAAGASSGYSAEAISYGNFSVSLTPNPGVPWEKLEAAYDVLLEQTLKDGITDQDVERAKTRMLARLAYAKESPMSAASQVGAALAVGLTLDDIENWPEQLKKVTPDQVRAAARKLIATASSGTGVLLPPLRVQEAAR